MPFNTSESMSTDIFDLIHFDVWGRSSISSIGGSQCFVVFVDDYSRYSWIFHMKHRSELLQVYSNFAKMVKTKFSKRIKNFQFDNALKYTQYAFQVILYSYGIAHQLTCPDTSQQNGGAEQKLHHILDTIRALLLSTKAFAYFEVKAAFHAVHATNRIPNLVIQNQISYEHFFGSPPDYHQLRSFDSAYSFFFSHMSITNLSLNLDFVVLLAMAKLKRGIGVMILSLIVFVSPSILSFRNITSLSSSLIFMPPYLPPLS